MGIDTTCRGAVMSDNSEVCNAPITLPGPVRAVRGLFKGCFEQNSYFPAWDPYGAVQILPPRMAPMKLSCMDYKLTGPVRFNASVTSHSRVPYGPGLFWGCFEQKSCVHSRGPHGPRTAPYEFCLPLRGPYGFRDRKQHLISPCEDCKGPVRTPYGQTRRLCGIFANSGCVNSRTCL